MHVVRESEGGEDEEKEQERESELHVGETHKPKNGPDWALSVLGGVVSSVSSSSVVLCWLQCEWRLLDQSVRRQRVSQSVLLECFCFRVRKKKA